MQIVRFGFRIGASKPSSVIGRQRENRPSNRFLRVHVLATIRKRAPRQSALQISELGRCVAVGTRGPPGGGGLGCLADPGPAIDARHARP